MPQTTITALTKRFAKQVSQMTHGTSTSQEDIELIIDSEKNAGWVMLDEHDNVIAAIGMSSVKRGYDCYAYCCQVGKEDALYLMTMDYCLPAVNACESKFSVYIPQEAFAVTNVLEKAGFYCASHRKDMHGEFYRMQFPPPSINEVLSKNRMS